MNKSENHPMFRVRAKSQATERVNFENISSFCEYLKRLGVQNAINDKQPINQSRIEDFIKSNTFFTRPKFPNPKEQNQTDEL